MLELETVTIEHPDEPGAWMIINKSDFNPEIHKIFKPKKPKATETDSNFETDANDETAPPELEPAKPRGRKKNAAAE
jgi:hypothetical protein